MQDIDREYISISEFARETGKSRTTVYKYLDSFLSTYVQQDAQGRKVISRAAVKVFESIGAGKVVQDERTDKRTEKDMCCQCMGMGSNILLRLFEKPEEKIKMESDRGEIGIILTLPTASG